LTSALSAKVRVISLLEDSLLYSWTCGQFSSVLLL